MRSSIPAESAHSDRPDRNARSAPDRDAPSAHVRSTPDLHALRTALLQQRRFRVDQLADLRSVVSDDPAQEEVTETLRLGARTALAGIEAALERMEQGAYGRCTGCDTAILPERLEILPAVALCMRCQQAADTPA